MSNEIMKTFNNDTFGSIRTLVEDGTILFSASDVAKALGYSVPRKAVLDHCRYVLKRNVPHPQSLDKEIEMSFIPESDLYRLIFSSKLPNAEKFTDWVTDEVLPSIRKHGLYATEDLIANPDLAIAAFTALKEEREKRKLLEQKNSEQAKLISSQADTISVLEPKASYCDMVLKAKNPITVTQIAKDYGMSAVSFNKLLKDLKIQYRSGDCWVLYQKYVNNGYTKSSTFSLDNQSSVIHTYWTQKGRLFLYDVLKKNGTLPAVEK